jgi:hypothetical protein
MTQDRHFHVAPGGSDSATGERNDPLLTLQHALERVFESGEPATIELAAGIYQPGHALQWRPHSFPITVRAAHEARAVISGGTQLSGWSVGEHQGHMAWTLHLPEVETGQWNFKQLWVNGARRHRPRLPKVPFEVAQGEKLALFDIAEVPGHVLDEPLPCGARTFLARPDQIRADLQWQGAEAVIPHFWTIDRLPISHFDPATRRFSSERQTVFSLNAGFQQHWASFYLDNLSTALSEPGEWYLDRSSGVLTYLPLPDENLETAEIWAPRLSTLLEARGLNNVRFENLAFSHTEWNQGPGGHDEQQDNWPADIVYGADVQAAYSVPGALQLRESNHVHFEGCTFHHLGGYALEIGSACQEIAVRRCRFFDLGAGGVHISGAREDGNRTEATGHCEVSDCSFYQGGRVFHMATAILIRHAHNCRILHNHIHEFFYTGISVGWQWDFQPSITRDILVEGNLIHDIGRGMLSDMAGIYTLGVSPGTVLRRNCIYHVHSAHYGGWGIYLDEGTSHILVEQNVAHSVTDQAFNCHYGRGNIVTENIFAAGDKGLASLGKSTTHEGKAFWLLRNIFISRGQPFFCSYHVVKQTPEEFASDNNIFWFGGEAGVFGHRKLENEEVETADLQTWQRAGFDRNSIVADPGIEIQAADVVFAPHSFLLQHGFDPITYTGYGPREEAPSH